MNREIPAPMEELAAAAAILKLMGCVMRRTRCVRAIVPCGIPCVATRCVRGNGRRGASSIRFVADALGFWRRGASCLDTEASLSFAPEADGVSMSKHMREIPLLPLAKDPYAAAGP